MKNAALLRGAALKVLVALTLILAASFSVQARLALAQSNTGGEELLAASNLTLKSATHVDLVKGIATLPLHKGTYNGASVWYVITDVSDARIAGDLGLNFAPRLANASNGCPACVQTVQSSDTILGRAATQYAGTIDFSPMRVLEPGPTGFPPLKAVPGAVAGVGYVDLVRVGAGNPVVYNAPIIATGDGPFDVTTHANTNDRVMAIDTAKMTVDLQFIRAFSHGKDIFYLTFGSSGALSDVLERGTFVPAMGTVPFANDSENPQGARSAIFTFVNGKRGETSPPAQGLMHVIQDNPPGDLSLQNTALLDSLRLGGDAHNVLDSFPTLSDQRLRELYTPLWDLHIAVWSDAAVAQGLNVTQKDANQIRQLAAQGLITNPGGGALGSANFLVNCPVLGFKDEAPSAPQAPNPMKAAAIAPSPQAASNPPGMPRTGSNDGATLISLLALGTAMLLTGLLALRVVRNERHAS